METNPKGAARGSRKGKSIAVALDVKNAPVGRHMVKDAPGLRLIVRASGGRFWGLRYMLRGRCRELGLGPASYDGKDGGVTLAGAKAEAARNRALARDGIDPVDARRAGEASDAADRQRTFRSVAESLIISKRLAWKNAKSEAQWRASLDQYAHPTLGDLPVKDIETRHVLDVLRPIWSTVPETAQRVRQRIEAILNAAVAAGWRDINSRNPAQWHGHLDHLLPARRLVAPAQGHPALPWRQMRAFFAALRKREGVGAKALAFTILTAARSGEVRGMTWGEVDLQAAIWRVAAERMKARKVHLVPLSAAAVALLHEVRPKNAKADGVVFPGERKGRPLSDMSLSAVTRGMALDGLAEGEPPRWTDADGAVVVPHGFRSTFRTWAAEATDFPRDLAEMALAHVVKGVEGAYQRGDMLERRRALMETWGRHCTGEATAPVVDLAEHRLTMKGTAA